MPAPVLRISQVEAEFPDAKIFSDPIQDIFLLGASIKNLVFRSNYMRQGGRRPGRWDRQFAVYRHKCSTSKQGWNSSAHPPR